jgi:hypothetical protein
VVTKKAKLEFGNDAYDTQINFLSWLSEYFQPSIHTSHSKKHQKPDLEPGMKTVRRGILKCHLKFSKVHELLSRVPGQLSSVVLKLPQLLPQLISLNTVYNAQTLRSFKTFIITKTEEYRYCSYIDFLFLSTKFFNSFPSSGTS